MKILHTSDWHLGRTLYGRKRYDEFEMFLGWLIDCIDARGIDILLIAGDVFDTTTPSNKAQQLYYDFLGRLSATSCNHVVITGGNHDSASFLNAPAQFMRSGAVKGLDIHIVGSATGDVKDEVIRLTGDDEKVKAIVCAVPYLRDRDIRSAQANESVDEKHQNLVDGIKDHYADVCDCAFTMKHSPDCGKEDQSDGRFVPVIAMGHLFTAGGKTVEGDGVRELYVGSLACVDNTAFPDSLDYVALGHLHVSQKVGGDEAVRYCGSPIPMGFGEARQTKSVVVIEWPKESDGKTITQIDVPRFQDLEQVSGTLDAILSRIEELIAQSSSAWLEIDYTGKEIVPDLSLVLDKAIENTSLEIRRIRNQQVVTGILSREQDTETLDELSETDVFLRCLKGAEIDEEEQNLLLKAFTEIVQEIKEKDVRKS